MDNDKNKREDKNMETNIHTNIAKLKKRLGGVPVKHREQINKRRAAPLIQNTKSTEDTENIELSEKIENSKNSKKIKPRPGHRAWAEDIHRMWKTKFGKRTRTT